MVYGAWRISLFHKSHSVSDRYPTMHHFVTEMCTRVRISFTNLVHCGIFVWYIVGFVRWVYAPETFGDTSLNCGNTCYLPILFMVTHYSDVIMGTMASQITSVRDVYSTVYLGADQRKHQSSASLALCAGNSPVTGEFPAQRASNAENVSIWWRHHD